MLHLENDSASLGEANLTKKLLYFPQSPIRLKKSIILPNVKVSKRITNGSNCKLKILPYVTFFRMYAVGHTKLEGRWMGHDYFCAKLFSLYLKFTKPTVTMNNLKGCSCLISRCLFHTGLMRRSHDAQATHGKILKIYFYNLRKFSIIATSAWNCEKFAQLNLVLRKEGRKSSQISVETHSKIIKKTQKLFSARRTRFFACTLSRTHFFMAASFCLVRVLLPK